MLRARVRMGLEILPWFIHLILHMKSIQPRDGNDHAKATLLVHGRAGHRPALLISRLVLSSACSFPLPQGDCADGYYALFLSLHNQNTNTLPLAAFFHKCMSVFKPHTSCRASLRLILLYVLCNCTPLKCHLQTTEPP